ncbi:MAG: hypothetical protein ACKOWF_12300 [Chloroflexota bacterium]
MTPEGFDRLVARMVTRRGALGAGAAAAAAVAGRWKAAVAAGPSAEGDAFSRDCDRFVLVGENKRKGEWDNVDDNMRIELFRKGSRRSEVIWDDTNDGGVNLNGQNFRIKEFDARVGDRIQITAYNLGGNCELDEIWLFCADGGRGKKIRSAFESTAECPSGVYPFGAFAEFRFRIKP